MTALAHQLPSQSAPRDEVPVAALSRQLAAAGLAVQISRKRDTCELTIIGVPAGKSLLTLNPRGHARWYFEPATGPSTNPATLTEIIVHLLSAPHRTASLAAYRALPLKGQVGRFLQDHGLAVALRVSEDLESFEATTDIDITSPTQPQLGTITVSDDAALAWHLNWKTAFHGDPTALIDVITPILRHR